MIHSVILIYFFYYWEKYCHLTCHNGLIYMYRKICCEPKTFGKLKFTHTKIKTDSYVIEKV